MGREGYTIAAKITSAVFVSSLKKTAARNWLSFATCAILTSAKPACRAPSKKHYKIPPEAKRVPSAEGYQKPTEVSKISGR
jgi:hypothetical protein